MVSEKVQELSEKARQNLQRNAELRNKDSKFFSPQPGEEVKLDIEMQKNTASRERI